MDGFPFQVEFPGDVLPGAFHPEPSFPSGIIIGNFEPISLDPHGWDHALALPTGNDRCQLGEVTALEFGDPADAGFYIDGELIVFIARQGNEIADDQQAVARIGARLCCTVGGGGHYN